MSDGANAGFKDKLRNTRHGRLVDFDVEAVRVHRIFAARN